MKSRYAYCIRNAISLAKKGHNAYGGVSAFTEKDLNSRSLYKRAYVRAYIAHHTEIENNS